MSASSSGTQNCLITFCSKHHPLYVLYNMYMIGGRGICVRLGLQIHMKENISVRIVLTHTCMQCCQLYNLTPNSIAFGFSRYPIYHSSNLIAFGVHRDCRSTESSKVWWPTVRL